MQNSAAKNPKSTAVRNPYRSELIEKTLAEQPWKEQILWQLRMGIAVESSQPASRIGIYTDFT